MGADLHKKACDLYLRSLACLAKKDKQGILVCAGAAAHHRWRHAALTFLRSQHTYLSIPQAVSMSATSAEETNKAYSYMLAPQRVAAGAVLRSGPDAPITVGNTLPLAAMPAGTQVNTE